MRMTNKIMQNNSLYNINQNKVLQDKLSTQMSTQKKLTRPSDDPVVAIRALRLRTSVSQITQYSTKNAEDAESWLKVTSDGLSTVTDILTDLSRNANKGANKDLTADDLDIIITQMKSLSEEFYSTGNLDYAGRYVFTGFRTDTPMSFTAADVSDKLNPIPTYEITEQIEISSFDIISYTDIDKLKGVTSSNYNDTSHKTVENDVQTYDIHRLRLAYDNISNIGDKDFKLKRVNSAGTGEEELTLQEIKKAANADEAYSKIISDNENDIPSAYLIPETGEILFSNGYYNNLIGGMSAYESGTYEFRLTYEKSEWANGDLRPEHYFACKSTDKVTGDIIEYNLGRKDPVSGAMIEKGYLDDYYVNKDKQVLAYDVGYNQTIEINTTADEVFSHSLTRDMDDLQKALNDLKNIEEIRKTLKTALESKPETDADYDTLKDQVDAANKAYTFIRENMHDLMQNAITKSQKYLDASNVAVTDNGTRSSRLSLIQNRLTEQKTTFETLQSENEDVDIADVAIKLTSAELTYESSLMATSKIMQTTLMNYI